MNIQEQIKELQTLRIEEIVNDDSLSKIEKLKMLEKEKLFGYASSLQTVFPEWEEEIIELERIEAHQRFNEGKDKYFYQSKMVDDIFDPSYDINEKYVTVSYADFLENCLDDFMEDDSDSVTVMTTRGPSVKLVKSLTEVIDKIYDYCIEHKIIGFKNDW